jgi:hypothetical protein
MQVPGKLQKNGGGLETVAELPVGCGLLVHTVPEALLGKTPRCPPPSLSIDRNCERGNISVGRTTPQRCKKRAARDRKTFCAKRLRFYRKQENGWPQIDQSPKDLSSRM